MDHEAYPGWWPGQALGRMLPPIRGHVPYRVRKEQFLMSSLGIFPYWSFRRKLRRSAEFCAVAVRQLQEPRKQVRGVLPVARSSEALNCWSMNVKEA